MWGVNLRGKLGDMLGVIHAQFCANMICGNLPPPPKKKKINNGKFGVTNESKHWGEIPCFPTVYEDSPSGQNSARKQVPLSSFSPTKADKLACSGLAKHPREGLQDHLPRSSRAARRGRRFEPATTPLSSKSPAQACLLSGPFASPCGEPLPSWHCASCGPETAAIPSGLWKNQPMCHLEKTECIAAALLLDSYTSHVVYRASSRAWETFRSFVKEVHLDIYIYICIYIYIHTYK